MNTTFLLPRNCRLIPFNVDEKLMHYSEFIVLFKEIIETYPRNDV